MRGCEIPQSIFASLRASREDSAVMEASMVCASSYSERASSPTVGSEKILGNLKSWTTNSETAVTINFGYTFDKYRDYESNKE